MRRLAGWLGRHKKGLLATFGALVLVLGLAGFWLLRQINPSGGPGQAVSVVIPPGTSASGIATRLDDKGVVTSARIFRLYLKLKGKGSDLQSGQYSLRENMSMGSAIATLERGPAVKYIKLTLPEGETLTEIAARVGKLPGRSEEKFLALAQQGAVRSKYQPAEVKTLEGLLFPDTYLLAEKEDEAKILARLVRRFDEVADSLDLATRPLPAGLRPYEVVVGASLVETEAKVPEDRPLIAGVIENRLEKGMRLQIDATVLYALGKHKSRVLFKDLEVDSPYNTYKVDGLPPTPIGASGKASLQAMLEPDDNDFIYYVLIDKNGKHGFAETDAEFQRLKAEAKRKGVL